MSTVGKTMRALRRERKWNQGIAAQRVGISIPAYSKIEAGVTDVNLSRLEEIAQAFNVTVAQLFGYNHDNADATLKALRAINQKIAEREHEMAELQSRFSTLHEELRIKQGGGSL